MSSTVSETSRSSVPPSRTSFHGREDEVAEIGRALDGGDSLVTLTGPAGMGKTRLACEFARRHGGPNLFCALSEAHTADQVLAAFVGALAPSGEAAGPGALAVIGRALASRGDIVVVVDNCEQAVEPIALVVTELRAAAPRARFLATSRERLRITGERVVEVPPLDTAGAGVTSPATSLFVERARLVRRGYDPSGDELAIIGALVGQLEGIPLAIELAAARTGALAVQDVRALVGRRLLALGSGPRDAPPRHRSLRAALDASWELLDPAERSALAQCSVFRGGFTLAAALAVVDVAGVERSRPVDELIESLHDKSLVRAVEPAGRFDLLETVREYATEQLAPADAAGAAERHAAFYLSSAANWRESREGGRDSLERVAAEMGNLLAVHERAASRPDARGAELALRAALALEPVLYVRAPLSLYVSVLDRALAHAGDDASPGLRASAIHARAHARRLLDEPQDPGEDLSRALALARQAGEPLLEGRVLTSLGGDALLRGVPGDAVGHFERALALFSAQKHPRLEAIARGYVGVARHALGELPAALDAYRQALAMLGALGDPLHGEYYRGMHAVALHESNASEVALRACDETIERLASLGEARMRGYFHGMRGVMRQQRGDVTGARADYQVAVDLLGGAGDRANEAYFRAALGGLVASLGDVDHGESELARARAAIAGASTSSGYAAALDLQAALVTLARGDVEQAARALAGGHEAAARSFEARLALALVRQALDDGPLHAIVVAEGGEWLRAPGAPRADLRTRGVLRRLAVVLAENRLSSPGVPVPIGHIVRAVWPGERVLPKAAAARVYTAISTLRGCGLHDLLRSDDRGYFLDPAVPLRLGRRMSNRR